MDKKVILFDLDGTLTDSGEGIMNSAAMVLERYGLPIPSREQLRVFIGPPLYETFQNFGISADQADNAVALYRSRYNTIGKFENAPYPGIRELLETLRSHGHRLFVATSKPEALSIEILEHFGLAQYFERICGASLDRSRSEKSAVIAYLLDTVGNIQSAIMVGDTAFDVIGAATHGIPAIGVSWGYGKVQEMIDAGALAIAYDMPQLLQLLEQ